MKLGGRLSKPIVFTVGLVLLATAPHTTADIIRGLENYLLILKGEKKVENLSPEEMLEVVEIHDRLKGIGSGDTGTFGDDYETEHKTNAEVCVRVSDVSLDCRKNYSDEYYRSCEVTVEYEVTTDYSGGSYLDADIECQIEIRYSERGTYSWRSNTLTQDEDHSLYSYQSDSEFLTFDFLFNSFNEVTQVKIDSASCEVDSVTL